MAYRDAITAVRLRELLAYDPETGVFTWLERPRNTRWAGKPAGTLSNGYISIHVDGITYWAHRLAWLYVHGTWPAEDLDHRDGDRINNRIDNLRLATDSQNLANAKVRRTNRSGYKGVTYDRRYRQPWKAAIMIQGKFIYLGTFPTPEAAHAAYVKAAAELFGEFARDA